VHLGGGLEVIDESMSGYGMTSKSDLDDYCEWRADIIEKVESGYK